MLRMLLFVFATAMAVVAAIDGALHHACAAGDAEKVQILIEKGAHSLTAVDDDFEASPLFVAAFYGRANVVAVLASNGVDVRASEYAGVTPLHLAAKEGHLDVVKLLCRTLGVPADEPSQNGETPLSAAAAQGHIQIVKLLVEEFSADVNSMKTDGVSPLLAATYSNHKNTARYLFALGADVFHKDQQGNDAIAAARQSGDSTLVGFMVRATQSRLNGQNYTEFAESLESERHSAELEEFETRRRLKDAPADPALRFSRALALAKLRRDGEVVDELSKAIELSADANFVPEARRLMTYVQQKDEESTIELFEFVAAHETDAYGIGAALSKALRLRDEFQNGASAVRSKAELSLHQLVGHMQQVYGLDLTVRSKWLDDGSFPLERGSIYGSSAPMDCQCNTFVPRKEGCQAIVVVETWRFVTHSYGLVGQQMLLGLNKVPGICVHVVNAPYLERNWRPGALGESQSMTNDLILQQIPVWDSSAGRCPDVLIRSYWPLDVTPSPCSKTKTIVFGATEFKRAPYRWLKQMKWWNETAGVTLITPSQWSAKGFVNDGVDPELIRILPHAVDAGDFHPRKTAAKAAKLRATRGWDDNTFVFLHIGSMLDRKGFKELVAAFAKLHEWFQSEEGFQQGCVKRRSTDAGCVIKLKLVLKGADRTANSAAVIENFERNGLDFRSLLESGAIEYIGDQLDSRGIATLLKASDTYASAYKAGKLLHWVSCINMPFRLPFLHRCCSDFFI
jgi:ankyrin repeat protein/glycosyltransferase involved in cell wall biosynthesis